MKSLRHLLQSASVARSLGFKPVSQYAIYQAGLKTGSVRRKTPIKTCYPSGLAPDDLYLDCIPLPNRDEVKKVVESRSLDLIQEANEVLQGYYRPFGGEPRPLKLRMRSQAKHWSQLRASDLKTEDIKFLWEPARFGWAIVLGRAYIITQNEEYARQFWENLEAFLEVNPPNTGPQWSSAQEVALRIICLALCLKIFSGSSHSTPVRMSLAASAMVEHARRIPPTLAYARAQNNNHLLSEAAGLYTAGLLLPEEAEAPRWTQTGWDWFNRAILEQFDPDGTYIQHSTNYHRMALQLALWVQMLAQGQGYTLFPLCCDRLGAASRWMAAQMDYSSGCATNLGHNDGSYILPLAQTPYTDYRPIAQAAARAFNGFTLFPQGPWDEMSLWFNLGVEPQAFTTPRQTHSEGVWRIGNPLTWATLKTATYTARPAHADLLHVDLWFNGENIALDPGTYRYSAPHPWNNSLTRTAVHNTVYVDGLDQMHYAGKFLWAHWVSAKIVPAQEEMTCAPAGESIVAELMNYHGLKLDHRRTLTFEPPYQWIVEDHILSPRRTKQSRLVCLHWNLPDGSWNLDNDKILWHNSHLTLELRVISSHTTSLRVDRAGEKLLGIGPNITQLGWFSPTYNVKKPCLSFTWLARAVPPVTFQTSWLLSSKNE